MMPALNSAKALPGQGTQRRRGLGRGGNRLQKNRYGLMVVPKIATTAVIHSATKEAATTCAHGTCRILGTAMLSYNHIQRATL